MDKQPGKRKTPGTLLRRSRPVVGSAFCKRGDAGSIPACGSNFNHVGNITDMVTLCHVPALDETPTTILSRKSDEGVEARVSVSLNRYGRRAGTQALAAWQSGASSVIGGCKRLKLPAGAPLNFGEIMKFEAPVGFNGYAGSSPACANNFATVRSNAASRKSLDTSEGWIGNHPVAGTEDADSTTCRKRRDATSATQSRKPARLRFYLYGERWPFIASFNAEEERPANVEAVANRIEILSVLVCKLTAPCADNVELRDKTDGPSNHRTDFCAKRNHKRDCKQPSLERVAFSVFRMSELTHSNPVKVAVSPSAINLTAMRNRAETKTPSNKVDSAQTNGFRDRGLVYYGLQSFTFTIGSTEGRAGRPVNSLNGTGDSSIDCRRNRNTYSRYQARPGGESILSASFGAGSLTNVPLGSMLDEARKPYALNPTKSTDCYSAPAGIRSSDNLSASRKALEVRLVGTI